MKLYQVILLFVLPFLAIVHGAAIQDSITDDNNDLPDNSPFTRAEAAIEEALQSIQSVRAKIQAAIQRVEKLRQSFNEEMATNDGLAPTTTPTISLS